MKLPHRKVWYEFFASWEIIKPTGRWKYVTNYLYKDIIYVEVRYGPFNLFTNWIHENDIEFLEETKEEIFDCKEKNK
ncbi:hypothetical protein M0R04_04640 [Candidatus Dojkabacteria bacterium]|jgi:hypothetical protein|nr:hypothetical protein [Candidatus Dojkabacteria bacterium]